ncbi:hypothetical protein QCA50_002552 [Cerrena zonata]|uniref:Pali-domain-containing protein n=1 Tax=Cerrena zonata TaxID=2478898 RepID=A0AAW0GVM8_9APHY
MGIIRPATPGFLVTLGGTICLALATFSAPFLKSIFFLKASLSQEGLDGSIVFGTFGYCLELASNGTTCSKAKIGYDLDINGLVGNDLPIKIPNVIVKWITYALILHAVALVLAAVSSVFGLLAHVREMAMTCCSTCVSGFAAAIAMLAFIFDIAFFFLAKTRINAIEGASASIGIGLWLTLAAWICLFFAGCFYCFGRCCISRRPRDEDKRRNKPDVDTGYVEQIRLDAVKAEADRKARQAKGEVGLPAFQEYESTPLTKVDHEEYLDNGHEVLPYHNNSGVGAGTAAYTRQGAAPPSHSGYSQAAPGTRAVDDYYNSRPNPRRQGSGMTGHTQTTSSYSASTYSAPMPNVPAIPPPPSNLNAIGTSAAMAGAAAGAGYLASSGGQYHDQYPSGASGAAYGHTAGGTSYHSAASHPQYASTYSTYADPFGPANPDPSSFNTDVYNSTAYMNHPASNSRSPPPTTQSPSNAYGGGYQAQPQAQRQYTLGGDGYGSNILPDHSSPTPQHQQSGGFDPYAPYYPPQSTSTPPMPQASSPVGMLAVPTSPSGPRPSSVSTLPMPSNMPQQPQYDDSPPMYDAATAQPAGQWGTKQ